MNCSEVQQRLNTAQASDKLAEDKAMLNHLQGCESCKDYAEELRLTRLLATMPVPPASEGFADRALAQAWETAHGKEQRKQPNRMPAWAGLAASALLAAVLVTQWVSPTSTNGPANTGNAGFEQTLVQVAPNTTRPVQVRMVSKEALPNATITVRLSGDVQLDGYPGQQSLTWQAPIEVGNNQMALPVRLNSNNSGTIVIEVSAGGAKKQMQLSVQSEIAAQESGYRTTI